MLSAAARLPEAVGVKVTFTVQLAPIAKLLLQLFVCEKSPACAPVTVMLAMVKAMVPVLVKVTACAGLADPTYSLPKEMLAGARETAADKPVPLRLIVCGELNALSLI